MWILIFIITTFCAKFAELGLTNVLGAATNPLGSVTGALGSAANPLASATNPLASATGALGSAANPLASATNPLASATGALGSATSALGPGSPLNSVTGALPLPIPGLTPPASPAVPGAPASPAVPGAPPPPGSNPMPSATTPAPSTAATVPPVPPVMPSGDAGVDMFTQNFNQFTGLIASLLKTITDGLAKQKQAAQRTPSAGNQLPDIQGAIRRISRAIDEETFQNIFKLKEQLEKVGKKQHPECYKTSVCIGRSNMKFLEKVANSLSESLRPTYMMNHLKILLEALEKNGHIDDIKCENAIKQCEAIL